MTSVEIVICLIMLFMAVPDLCRKWGRPALSYSAFVLFGLLLNPVVGGDVKEMVIQAGKVGFLLLLFEVGLEIDLPPFRQFLRPVRFAVWWSLFQYPVVILLAIAAGLSFWEALLGASALTACSVGMAHAGWKQYGGMSGETKSFVLQVMVALEVLAIVFLSVEMAAVEKGISWSIGYKLAGMALVIWLVSRFASHLVKIFQTILARATHWRVHLLVLMVLVICAMGERLGLSGPKTAFFLGLFMSHAQHDGKDMEEYMAPISQRFLIPVFFVALGLQIEWRNLYSLATILALGSAFLVLGIREVMHRRWLKTGGDAQSYLLLCPNLTMVALASSVLLGKSDTAQGATWLLLTGLFITVPSVLMLPKAKPLHD
jgi:Kef-type K+ transport system membrane component KefB